MLVEILTPGKIVFSGNADAIQIPSEYGMMGVLENHASIISGLKPGSVTITQNKKKTVLIIDYGIFEFHKNVAKILTETAKNPTQNDLD